MKEKILQTLFETSEGINSGVALAEKLGISRVAVWKHIKALKESGIDIDSTSKGYCLKNRDDLLFPFCFDQYSDKIHFFPSVLTTMDTAKQMAKDGCEDFSVIIAKNQTKGRGRLNREWVSEDGGLWFTLILKPDIPPPLAFILNFAASLSLCQTLNTLFKINATVKWPNDILVEDKKLAGLLSEMETEGDMLRFVNIGIGLNVNNDPLKHTPDSASIKNIIKKECSKKTILTEFLASFENRYKRIINRTIDNIEIILLWKEQTSTIGKNVAIETFGERYEGLAEDVDNTGALILKTKDSSGKKIRKRVIYGDCFYKGKH